MKKKNISRKEKLFKNLLQATYEFIKGRHYVPLTKTSLIERLQINQGHLEIFDKVLKKLRLEEKIEYEEEKYAPAITLQPTEKLKTGIITVHARGFGFVTTDEAEDIFIPKQELHGAIDSDKVEVLIDTTLKNEKGPEGRVIKILERSRKTICGTITEVHSETAFAFCPLLIGTEQAEVCLTKEERENITVGDRYVFSIVTWGNKNTPPCLKPHIFIANIKDASKDILEAIFAFSLPQKFPKKVVQEAKSFKKSVSKREIEGRRDLQHLETCTIDPDTAKDYDDALSIEIKNKKYHLWVHIADVSHYVKRLSELDKEAFSRANSVYFPGTCIPMLPFELSNELCSLKEGVPRLTVTCYFVINFNGEIERTEVFKSVIKSKKRLTYKQAKELLDSKEKSALKNTLTLMKELAEILKEKRKNRGSVELSLPEVVVKIDDKGVPIGTEIITYDITHQMVEEFMLLANEAVAKKLSKEGKALTWRIHEEPSKENMRDFAALVNALGFQLGDDPTPEDIQKVFYEARKSQNDLLGHLATSYIRSMRLAAYSVDNIGHYGLSLEHYCHFTSPIRRYVDLIAHRLLFEEPYTKEEIEAIADHASEKERLSSKAENSVLSLKKLRYLGQVINKDRFFTFDAVCTRIKPFGIHFNILGLMIEGFLHISELEDDYFIFNPKKNFLQGRHTKKLYKTADSIHVRIKRIDLITQEITWQLVIKKPPKKR